MVKLQTVTSLLAVLASTAQAVDIVVKSTGGNKTSKMPYGLMHEDINYAGDGGIYAELIRNRAFQGSKLYPSSLDGWKAINGAQLSLQDLSKPLSDVLYSSLNVEASSNTKESTSIGFSNSGFWGFDVKAQKYKGSFYVKGEYKGKFTASLQSASTQETFGTVQVESKSKKNDWVQHSFTLVPKKNAPNSNNTFALTFDPAGVKSGSLDFNLISLFPPTYKGRENGLRLDIATAFADIDPKFLRFPGGNALEGPDLANIWKWNETIGPLKNRPGRPGVWGYQTSDGLGLVEYLHWCDDMDLEPILAIWSGLALDGGYIKEAEFQPWIDDALNEIEFIRGDISTPYGALRASLGYPKPWTLKYVEVGNEDWLAGYPAGFESYIKYRFPLFQAAIAKKYPDIQVIASPSVYDGFVVPEKAAGDYHPYRQPNVFYNDFHKFDSLTSDNLTLVGEFAATHPNGGSDWDGPLYPHPWWQGAIGEAIFMISTERNGDRILGTTYAPIMRNMNDFQWPVCMLEFDASQLALTTSYHVFKLISTHGITKNLPTTPVASNTTSLFWVAGTDEERAGSRIVKFANYNTTAHADTPVSVRFEGIKSGKQGKLTLLTGKDGPWGYNDFKTNVVTEENRVLSASKDGAFNFVMPELSAAVLEV